MNRLRLFAASVLLRIARALLRVNAALIAGLLEAPSPVAPSCTEPPGTALEALTAEEVVRAIEKFSNERAPTHPAEAVYFVLYIERFAAGIAPFVAKLTESQPTPTAPPEDDAVN